MSMHVFGSCDTSLSTLQYMICLSNFAYCFLVCYGDYSGPMPHTGAGTDDLLYTVADNFVLTSFKLMLIFHSHVLLSVFVWRWK